MIRDYRCKDCKREFELDVPVTSKLESRKVIKVKCSVCKSSNVERIFKTPPSVIFKGKGFYVTDKESKS